MSRYEKFEDDFGYSWGYDRPLQEYFYQKFVEKADDGIEFVFSIGTGIVEVPHPDYPKKKRFNRGELLTIMENEGIVPEEHLKLIALDLQIE